MGYWSDKSIEVSLYGRGWLDIEKKSVCIFCLSEEGLAKFIIEHAEDGFCSYCGKKTSIASMGEIVPHILTSLSLEWGDPSLELPYDPEDKKWIMGEPTDSYELLEELIFSDNDGSNPQELIDDINSTMYLVQWAKIDAVRSNKTELLTNSWQAFCHIVKHERRFFFNVEIDDPIMPSIYEGEVDLGPQGLLLSILDFLRDHKRLKTMSKGWSVKRGRIKVKGTAPYTAAEMGPPPIKCATQPNRMSPSGVSMFYGSTELEVCLREITTKADHFACGTFEVDREIVLVDLTGEILIPSLFNEHSNKDRPLWSFIKYFLDDFRQPIEKDGREHIDYVPTQVVSEFFKSSNHEGVGRISGILYDSAPMPGKQAVVLFADSSCISDESDVSNSFKLNMIGYEELDFEPKGGQIFKE